MRIVTGLAASGKTSMLLREIAEKAEANRGRQILLVPELNSHQMERRLAAATHNHGARTAEVLTFSRLADRVFAVVGGLLVPSGGRRHFRRLYSGGRLPHAPDNIC